MVRNIPALSYKSGLWDVRLPTVRAHNFSNKEISDFVQGDSSIPLMFDTNMVNACNTNCIYCATQGGDTDVRFKAEKKVPFVSDEQYKELVKQFGELGVQTFFICSNGEPLLNPKRFLGIARAAAENEVRVITYTNGTTLSKPILRELYNARVSLVIKLESLIPETNDAIILNADPLRKRGFQGFQYTQFEGKKIPKNILDAYETYGSDRDMLGIETMITKQNFENILELRRFIFEKFGSAQFLKHLYPLGYTSMTGKEVSPEKKDELALTKQIIELDKSFGFVYPNFQTADYFSYDSRRLLNNIKNAACVPLRMFGHERGGVYHSSKIVPIKFGFGTKRIIKLVDECGKINAKRYFDYIKESIQFNMDISNG